MPEVKARKAVVTMDAVSKAFGEYADLRKAVGVEDLTGHTFDRGFRGKGFAQYDANDNIVRSFDGKEEAFNLYSGWVTVAREILAAMGQDADKAPESVAETPEADSEGTDKAEALPEPREASQSVQTAVPAQTRRRAKATASA